MITKEEEQLIKKVAQETIYTFDAIEMVYTALKSAGLKGQFKKIVEAVYLYLAEQGRVSPHCFIEMCLNVAFLKGATDKYGIEKGVIHKPIKQYKQHEIVLITRGEYESQYNDQLLRVLKDFTDEQVELFFSAEPDEVDFIKFLIDNHYVKEMEYKEWGL